jgi:hypothetical protein
MKNLLNLYDDLNWENADEYSIGTKRKVLRDENGGRTVLLKLPKDFYMSPHSHVTTEQDLMVSPFRQGHTKFSRQVMNMDHLNQKTEP